MAKKDDKKDAKPKEAVVSVQAMGFSGEIWKIAGSVTHNPRESHVRTPGSR